MNCETCNGEMAVARDGGFDACLACHAQPIHEAVSAATECIRSESMDASRDAGMGGLRWFSISRFTDGDVLLAFSQLGASSTIHVTADEAARLGKLLIEVAS